MIDALQPLNNPQRHTKNQARHLFVSIFSMMTLQEEEVGTDYCLQKKSDRTGTVPTLNPDNFSLNKTIPRSNMKPSSG